MFMNVQKKAVKNRSSSENKSINLEKDYKPIIFLFYYFELIALDKYALEFLFEY